MATARYTWRLCERIPFPVHVHVLPAVGNGAESTSAVHSSKTQSATRLSPRDTHPPCFNQKSHWTPFTVHLEIAIVVKPSCWALFLIQNACCSPGRARSCRSIGPLNLSISRQQIPLPLLRFPFLCFASVELSLLSL